MPYNLGSSDCRKEAGHAALSSYHSMLLRRPAQAILASLIERVSLIPAMIRIRMFTMYICYFVTRTYILNSLMHKQGWLKIYADMGPLAGGK